MTEPDGGAGRCGRDLADRAAPDAAVRLVRRSRTAVDVAVLGRRPLDRPPSTDVGAPGARPVVVLVVVRAFGGRRQGRCPPGRSAARRSVAVVRDRLVGLGRDGPRQRPRSGVAPLARRRRERVRRVDADVDRRRSRPCMGADPGHLLVGAAVDGPARCRLRVACGLVGRAGGASSASPPRRSADRCDGRRAVRQCRGCRGAPRAGGGRFGDRRVPRVRGRLDRCLASGRVRRSDRRWRCGDPAHRRLRRAAGRGGDGVVVGAVGARLGDRCGRRSGHWRRTQLGTHPWAVLVCRGPPDHHRVDRRRRRWCGQLRHGIRPVPRFRGVRRRRVACSKPSRSPRRSWSRCPATSPRSSNSSTAPNRADRPPRTAVTGSSGGDRAT